MSDVKQSPDKGSRSVLGVILLTVFLDLVGFSLIFPLFPALLEHYVGQEGDTGLLAWLLGVLRGFAPVGERDEFYTVVLFGGVLGSIYSLLQFVFAPLWGALSDRIGRRPVLIVTVAGVTLSYALWFVAGSFALLVLARVLGGVMAGNLSVATAAIADTTTTKDRAKGMGFIGAAFGIGFILGPTLGGVLSLVHLEHALAFVPGINPFSGAALGAMLLSAINLVWVVRRFPETRRPAGHSARRPINPATLFARTDFPEVNRTNLVYFIFIAAFAGMEFTLTFLARDRFDYTPLKNALIFLYVGVLVALVQGGLVRRLAPRHGEQHLVITGIALILPGLLIIGAAPSELVLYVGLSFLAVGSALTTPSLTALVSLYAPDDRQGEILGTFRSLGSLARAIAPLTASVLYWRYGSSVPYFASALLLLVPLALAFTLPRVKGARG
jgi:MFS family permease